MVTVYIGGGLANKMFQYAFSLAIKKKGYELNYDTQSFKSEFSHDTVALQDIFTNVEIDEVYSLKYIAAGKQSKLFRLWKRLSPHYITEHNFSFNSHVWTQLRKTCYVDSSWQNEKYFIEAEHEVRKAFIFPPFKDKKNLMISKEMGLTNSVAIHIRKGDGYKTWDIFKNTCLKEYYSRSIEYIKKHIKNPTFYVFTDCPELLDEYLDIDDYKLIDWNPTVGINNYLDMQLMSCAKHNIIANSTYSWWGAWLNNNPNKIVIGPLYWFNPEIKIGKKNLIIPNHWVKL